MRPDALLFGESQSRIIVTAAKEHVREIEKKGGDMKVPVKVIGKVGGKRFVVKHASADLINVKIEVMAEAWGKAISRSLDEGDR